MHHPRKNLILPRAYFAQNEKHTIVLLFHLDAQKLRCCLSCQLNVRQFPFAFLERAISLLKSTRSGVLYWCPIFVFDACVFLSKFGLAVMRWQCLIARFTKTKNTYFYNYSIGSLPCRPCWPQFWLPWCIRGRFRVNNTISVRNTDTSPSPNAKTTRVSSTSLLLGRSCPLIQE